MFIILCDVLIYPKVLYLIFLFVPALGFSILLWLFKNHPVLELEDCFPFVPLEFLLIIFFGTIATLGGTLDWLYHRNNLGMKISKKERDAEAIALGFGGIPMFILMWLGTFSESKELYLIPIIIVLIYTVVMICYDEFVFHQKRCGRTENLLVFNVLNCPWLRLIKNNKCCEGDTE